MPNVWTKHNLSKTRMNKIGSLTINLKDSNIFTKNSRKRCHFSLHIFLECSTDNTWIMCPAFTLPGSADADLE